jgi:tetratricopeptide (TPR) repeat protein
MKMLFALLIWAMAVQAFGQANPSYEQGKKLHSESKFAEAKKAFISALEIENKKEPLDKGMRGRIHEYLGLCTYMLAGFVEANEWYNKAAADYYQSGLYADLGMIFARLNTSNKWAYAYDVSTMPSTDANKQEEIYFQVTKVVSQTKDSVKVLIDAGSLDGVTTGTVGYLSLSYNSKNPQKSSSNIFVARLTVTRISANQCEAVGAYYSDTKGANKNIYEGDLVALKIPPAKNKSGNIFADLAALNILFRNADGDTLLSQSSLLRLPYNESEERILAYSAWDCRSFYESYLKDNNDSMFTDKFTSGRWKGQNMKDAFRLLQPIDLHAFLHFVKSFPGKYMGKAWKLNETYATWLINNTPAGEKGKMWLLPYISSTPLSQMDSFAIKYQSYLREDSLLSYWEGLNQLYNAQRFEEALDLNKKLLTIAHMTRDPGAVAGFTLYSSYVYDKLGNKQEALNRARLAYTLDKNSVGAAFNLAALYGQLEKFDSCFALLEPMVKKYPEYSNAIGSLGWYKITAGKLTEAIPHCRNAFLLDSTNMAWAVNYGHTFLLSGGSLDSARKYYHRSLENLSSPSDYAEGPKKDLELFFSKGWKRVETAAMLEWMEKEYENKYKYLTTGNQIWIKARASYDKGQYDEAANTWKEYVASYKPMKQPPLRYIHNAYAWMGESYKLNAQPDLAEKYYLTATQWARDSIRDQLLLIEDYQRMFEFYNKGVNAKKARDFKLLYDVEKQKYDDAKASPQLYLICVEGENSLQPESKLNAKKFFAHFDSLSRKSFDSLHGYYLSGEKATKSYLTKLMNRVTRNCRPEDVLLFYYTGAVITTAGKENEYRLAKNNDAEESSILEADLLALLKDPSMHKKLIISDVPAPGMLSKLTMGYNTESYNLNEVIFTCPGVLTSVNENGTSAFTEQLLESASILSADSMFTAKQLLEKAAYGLGRGKYYLPMLSFAYAKDFSIYKNAGYRAQEEATRSVMTRKPATAQSTESVSETGRNFALLFATNNYKELNQLSNPVFDATELGKILKESFGFETELVINPTRDEMENKLAEYRDNKIYGPNDQLLIFFAGHGVYNENSRMGFLAATDSKKADPYFRSYLSYADLGGQYLTNIKCNRIFVTLDACFAGSFFDQSTVRGDEPTAASIEILKRNATGKKYYKGISSGGKEYVADGRPGQHSPFAASFINTLTNKAYSNSIVTGDVLIASIKSNPPQATSICEGKFQYSDPTSHFIFELKASPSAAPTIKTDKMQKSIGGK